MHSNTQGFVCTLYMIQNRKLLFSAPLAYCITDILWRVITEMANSAKVLSVKVQDAQ